MINNLFATTKTHKIFGTAGAGKTTFLISEMEKLLQKGVKAEEICFVSFTKKAIEEITERMKTKFPNEKGFKYFKTLHALCLSFSPNKNLIVSKDLMKIATEMGMEVSTFQSAEDGAGSKQGDKIMTIESLSRLRMVSLKQQWVDCNFPDCPFYLVQEWQKNLEDYKEKYKKVDFTDLLLSYNNGPLIGVKYFIIDEAQDLSPLQWKVINDMSSQAKKVFLAGDDDQAIYNWAGADVNYILNIKSDEETILDKTYRLPLQVYNVSRGVLSNIKNRQAKEKIPENDNGKVIKVPEFEFIDFDKDQEYMILVRNRFQTKDIERQLQEKGLIYNLLGKSSTNNKESRAILLWENFRKTGSISSSDYQLVQNYSSFLRSYRKDEVPKNMLKSWFEVLNLIPEKTINYFRTLLENGYRFNDTPKIRISTIHQSKGGECDNVILFTDMSKNTHDSLNSDDEHRVWFVAVSRAKKNLFIIREKGNRYYNKF